MSIQNPRSPISASAAPQQQAASAPDMAQLIADLSKASSFEQAGNIEEARQLYQYVLDSDPDGSLGISARKALESMEMAHPFSDGASATEASVVEQAFAEESQEAVQSSWLANLSVRGKQYLALFGSEFVTVAGVAGLSLALLVSTGRTQLKQQTESELAVNDIEYNIKINQMGFGFRGQSDNAAVIAAASAHQKGEAISPELQAKVEAILDNEINARVIEYATLVGTDRRIIASANADRKGEEFDPNGLVSEVLANPAQIKTSELVTWEELSREAPPLPEGFEPGEDALIRYTVTPVQSNGEVIGALLSGDIVNGKLPIAAKTVEAFDGGYSAVYLVNESGQFELATAFASNSGASDLMAAAQTGESLDLPNKSILEQAVAADGAAVTIGAQRIGDVKYTLAANSFSDYAGNPVTVIVRGHNEAEAGVLVRRNLGLQMGVAGAAVGLNVLLGSWLTRSFVGPIKRLMKATQDFAKGDRSARAEVLANDEIGALAQNFNQMAASIGQQEAAMEAQSLERKADAEFQRQEKEKLQQEVVKLLLDIDGARDGDLTVRANVDDGEMGSVADAFNNTIRNLKELVYQVKSTSEQVQTSANQNEQSVQKLSQEATAQAETIMEALTSVEDMSQSIQLVAESAQEAAEIARLTLEASKEGETSMDLTVDSIDNIRNSSAETSKKVKRLAESSQEISKIVGIISSISEKTNLLAFNASIEAARAGENGQGFRIVADEVRRLAERVTESTKEIEQLVTTIQAETGDVLQQIEESTSQVVEGTQLVNRTKNTLQQLATISQKTDELLQSISNSTESQAKTSETVTQTMKEVVQVAQNTSSESQEMSSSLRELVGVASSLENSVAKFRVENK